MSQVGRRGFETVYLRSNSSLGRLHFITVYFVKMMCIVGLPHGEVKSEIWKRLMST